MGKKKKNKLNDMDWYMGSMGHPGGKGSKKVQEMRERYGVKGTMSVKPSARNLPEHFRDADDVKRDLEEAMANDYDTRRSIEAAALNGNKEAQKMARKGISAKNAGRAWDLMKDLKKEYVGGGGMRGAKNEAGLTQAIVEADRKSLLSKIGSGGNKTEDEVKENTDPNKYFQSKYLSPHLEGVNDRLSKEYPTPLYDSTERASSAFASDYIGDVVSGLNLSETTKLNLDNAYAYLNKDREEEEKQRNVDFR